MDGNDAASSTHKCEERTSFCTSSYSQCPFNSIDEISMNLLEGLVRNLGTAVEQLSSEEDRGSNDSHAHANSSGTDLPQPQPSQQIKKTLFGLKKWMMSGTQKEKESNEAQNMPCAC
ncbi:hypothetical protein CYLTODRAFT_444631 [Cylindrobasidium torrendii FP15055 ss-10]|uniref:Uncharacterized protein n=1 Tax=Cylindrobasidium torrendii FP15055 ss-10 TaxID=1314674 RepID=A0A0D7B8B1_9AGAR|nr:hypothetical protein CYLTODRAFT_444631 [Cylindrobasidium torrendii FP15055 ss-10]